MSTIRGVPESTHRRAVEQRKLGWQARQTIERGRTERNRSRWHIVYALAEDPDFVVFDAELFFGCPHPTNALLGDLDWEEAARRGARGVLPQVEWEDWEPIAMVTGVGIEYHAGQDGWRTTDADLLTAQQVLAGEARGATVVFLHGNS